MQSIEVVNLTSKIPFKCKPESSKPCFAYVGKEIKDAKGRIKSNK